MESILAFLAKYGSVISAVSAGIAFMWTIIQFLAVRAREAESKDFENFHKLIKELVEPPTPEGSLYVDRQSAILFELRFFPRYYPVIKRTLLGLQTKWTGLVGEGKYERLLDEVAITLKYINEHETKTQRLFRGLRPVKY